MHSTFTVLASATAATPPIIARVSPSLQEINADAWNQLLSQQSHPTPFLRHEYLLAMEQSDSATVDTGWLACHLTLWQSDKLVAACPMYLKSHSWGEYVFDFAWANAWQAHGQRYYPKALIASPFTPVPGTRLIAKDPSYRSHLLHALATWLQAQSLETVHILFIDETDRQALSEAGWLLRQGLQFHWRNGNAALGGAAYTSFDQFLEQLQRDKRRKIKQEMRKVHEAGVRYRVLTGAEITKVEWDFFYQCYSSTYLDHGNAPYLTQSFWQNMQTSMSQYWVLFLAEVNGQPIACSLIGVHQATVDGGQECIAYGRYWGALQRTSGLHFDLCYYQPLQWCIEQKIDRFEGGAQGEHKLARALMPETTTSAHWIADPAFRHAIQEFLGKERHSIQHYQDALERHSPFKNTLP